MNFLDNNRRTLKTVPAIYPKTEKDYPGFRFYEEVEKLDGNANNVTALFSISDDRTSNLFLQVMLPGTTGRSYFKAKSLKTKTSGKHYAGRHLPLFTIHTDAEARTKPFIAVFEPYQGNTGFTVEHVTQRKVADPGNFTDLTVFCKGNTYQEIYQSVDPDRMQNAINGYLKGSFGVASILGDQLISLYLGKGTEVSNHGFALKSITNNGSATLSVKDMEYQISCNQVTEITIPIEKIKKASLTVDGTTRDLKVAHIKKGILISVPTTKNGIIRIN